MKNILIYFGFGWVASLGLTILVRFLLKPILRNRSLESEES
ncbi:MAG: hypothetical protein R3A11_00745 [Bdellovibrionota bacterium]